MSLKNRLDRLERLAPPPATEFDLQAFFLEQEQLAAGNASSPEPVDPAELAAFKADLDSYATDEFSGRPDAIRLRLDKRRQELENKGLKLVQPDDERTESEA